MRDVRVLELAGSLAGAYCTRLFATTGSDVVLAEPATGGAVRAAAPWIVDERGARRSASHEYLDAGKRSAVLDDGELDAAFRWADLVVSTADGDVAAAQQLRSRIAAADASTVHVVLSGFGLSGPYAARRNSPLVDWASGGYLYLTGEPDREPLQGGGPWATYLTGATAAIAAQAALIDAARTGEGQLVDVGAMEAVASGHQWSLTMYTHTGAVKGRWGARFGEAHHPMALYRCADGGWICIGAPSRDQWENFCITTDTVELLADDALYAPGVRFERAAEIDAAAAPFLASHTAEQAVEALQANRVPASRVLDYAEVLASDHLQARDFWLSRDDVAPGARMPGPPFRLGDVCPLTAAPPVGAHTDDVRAELVTPPSRAPLPRIDLATVRMVEFGLAWAGPLAGRWLADLGVDVVKVEHPASRGFASAPPPPEGLAPWRWGEYAPPQIRADVYPDAEPGERRWNRMGIFNKMNRQQAQRRARCSRRPAVPRSSPSSSSRPTCSSTTSRHAAPARSASRRSSWRLATSASCRSP